jgi:hypothetical protein
MAEYSIENQIRLHEKSDWYEKFLFLVGFFSFCNGVFFKLGVFNVRISEIFFYSFPILVFLYFQKVRIRKSELFLLSLIFLLFMLLVLRGMFPFITNEAYNSAFLKILFNRIVWIPIYALVYLVFRRKVLFVFLLGLFIGLCVNSVFVLLNDISYLQIILCISLV